MRQAWLGRQAYVPCWERLRRQAQAIADGLGEEVIWACEHEPVYTTGRRGVDNRRGALPAPLVHTDRGGETTFHGPGQLMLYPVVHVRARGIGVRAYVGLLEASCVQVLRALGVEAERREGFPGVWTARGKIAALGVRVRYGVAYHGMALNVTVDRDWFAPIHPCGLRAPVDRLADWVQPPPIPEIAVRWAQALEAALDAA